MVIILFWKKESPVSVTLYQSVKLSNCLRAVSEKKGKAVLLFISRKRAAGEEDSVFSCCNS